MNILHKNLVHVTPQVTVPPSILKKSNRVSDSISKSMQIISGSQDTEHFKKYWTNLQAKLYVNSQESSDPAVCVNKRNTCSLNLRESQANDLHLGDNTQDFKCRGSVSAVDSVERNSVRREQYIYSPSVNHKDNLTKQTNYPIRGINKQVTFGEMEVDIPGVSSSSGDVLENTPDVSMENTVSMNGHGVLISSTPMNGQIESRDNLTPQKVTRHNSSGSEGGTGVGERSLPTMFISGDGVQYCVNDPPPCECDDCILDLVDDPISISKSKPLNRVRTYELLLNAI